MPETTPQIIGLEKERVDPRTTAITRFHVVHEYAVNLQRKTSVVTMACYYTREAFLAGKESVTLFSLGINAAPAGDSTQFPTWFARQLLESSTPHDLSGATPVYERVDAMAEQAVGAGDEEPVA